MNTRIVIVAVLWSGLGTPSQSIGEIYTEAADTSEVSNAPDSKQILLPDAFLDACYGFGRYEDLANLNRDDTTPFPGAGAAGWRFRGGVSIGALVMQLEYAGQYRPGFYFKPFRWAPDENRYIYHGYRTVLSLDVGPRAEVYHGKVAVTPFVGYSKWHEKSWSDYFTDSMPFDRIATHRRLENHDHGARFGTRAAILVSERATFGVEYVHIEQDNSVESLRLEYTSQFIIPNKPTTAYGILGLESLWVKDGRHNLMLYFGIGGPFAIW